MRFFCAAESRERGESVIGTVALIRSWLLIEYPSAWRRHALEDSRLIPDPVKLHVAQLQSRGDIDRTLLIRTGPVHSRPLQCFLVDSRPDKPAWRRMEIASYDELPSANTGPASSQIMYAVCTHGRHDKCCAKYGLPVFCALQELVPERAWQCSHVGGDRFAGNVVVFPHGIYYGRVTPEHVEHIVRHTEAGEVWMPGYRGRSCYPRSVQVAEHFARIETGWLGIDDFAPLRMEHVGTDVTRVELRARGAFHAVEYRTIRGAFQARLTCSADHPSEVPQYELLAHSTR